MQQQELPHVHPGEKPEDLVMALAHAKAEAIKGKMAAAGEDYKTGYLLTCDQVLIPKDLRITLPGDIHNVI
eukprot:1151375-Pelagomonas_calceolata.AAC.1